MPAERSDVRVALARQARGDARLCVCIDDFGMHGGVNAATQRLIEMERVHAVGVLVGAAAFAGGAVALRRLQPGHVDVGLHLDLTEFCLVPGVRQSLRSLLVASWTHRLKHNMVRKEIQAQLDGFEAALDRAPDFVDGHQHVHQFPGVREALISELSERYPGRHPWLRSTRRPAASGLARASTEALKAASIEWLGERGLSSLAHRHGFLMNNRLLGVYGLGDNVQRYRALLRGWLQSRRDGDLLMCHASGPTDASDAILPARQMEYRELASAAFHNALRTHGVSLAPTSRILAAPWQPGSTP